MNLRRTDRRLLAWLLYCSLLFSALACSVGHGQMAALQLSGLPGQFCALGTNASAAIDLGDGSSQQLLMPADSGCALSSLFSAVLLAALFGLLGLFALLAAQPLPALPRGLRSPRYLWPSANPRASPYLA
jgi:hypothetical protein